MNDSTIMNNSPVGQHIQAFSNSGAVSYLMFNKQKIQLVAKITIGRDTDNSVVIDNKLASRHHALIQKIKDDYFLKDENPTNGTFLNDRKNSCRKICETFARRQNHNRHGEPCLRIIIF